MVGDGGGGWNEDVYKTIIWMAIFVMRESETWDLSIVANAFCM